MANAARDENNRPTIILASKNDGVTIVRAWCNPTTHSLIVIDGSSGSNNGNNGGNAMLDENSVPVWTALSSAGDGSIVEVYGDPSTHRVLVQST